ncbi:MAG: putative transcriptional regulator [Candidatus Alkanophagales archaeon MCA70_species_2]|nr:putative transcriptional regulator [Candidatus Alkanophaga liquidiphilum]
MYTSFLQYDPRVVRSLKRSRVRVAILLYLNKIYPNMSYPAEIARNIGIDATNVLGGLRGMGSRYNGSSSLVELGLVDKVDINGVSYYKLSKIGKQVVDILESSLF